MEASSEQVASLVIDASIAVWAVVPAAAPFDTLKLIGGWRRRGVRLLSPSLFLAESTSAIRKLVHGGILSVEEGSTALSDLLDLDVDIIQETGEHCRAAFRWAERLEQSKAYDGFYLAVAEYADSELWTADERLVHSARDKNIGWVHWAGEAGTAITE
jgi:predicted nucleic acid-binding protein